jgi:hypothetical protein
MAQLVRLSFSLEKPLHDRLEGLVRGKANAIRDLAGLLQQQKGVLHASVSMSTTGKRLA